MCLKEIVGGETEKVILSSGLHVLGLSCPWNVYVQIAGCVSCTYGKITELEMFNCIL